MTRIDANQIVAVKTTKEPFSRSQTGYGAKLPTRFMVQLEDKQWRRIYVACYSNSGTAYVQTKADKFCVFTPDAEYKIQDNK